MPRHANLRHGRRGALASHPPSIVSIFCQWDRGGRNFTPTPTFSLFLSLSSSPALSLSLSLSLSLAHSLSRTHTHTHTLAGGGRAGGAVPLVPRHANLRHGRVHLLLLWLLLEGPQGPQEDIHTGCDPHDRFQEKKEHLDRLKGLLPESQGRNLSLTVLNVPNSIDSWNLSKPHPNGLFFVVGCVFVTKKS